MRELSPWQSFDGVLREELDSVDTRRQELFKEPKPDCRAKTACEQALTRNLVGMGLSGGGIRSATLNLGILQGLAEKGLLPYIDYLSTVSGGGYIGSWLHGVIARAPHRGDPCSAQAALSPASNPVPKPPDVDPVSFLRKFSNYLAPRLSPFSADIWVIVSIWIRNILLNQCVLVPLLAGILLLPVIYGLGLTWLHDHLTTPVIWIGGCAAFFLLLYSVLGIGARLDEIVGRQFPLEPNGNKGSGGSERSWPRVSRWTKKWVTRVHDSTKRLVIWWQGRLKRAKDWVLKCSVEAEWYCIFVFLAALLVGSIEVSPREWDNFPRISAFALLWFLFWFLQVWGNFGGCFLRRHQKKDAWVRALHCLWMPLTSAVITAALLWGVLEWMNTWGGAQGAWLRLMWGPALIVVCLSTGVSLLIGFMGADYPDACREWLSKVGASLLIVCTGWVALFALGVFMPYWLALLFAAYWGTAVSLVGGWIATTAGGVFAGYSGKTRQQGASGSSSALEMIGRIAPPVFMIGYLAAISFGLHAGLRAMTGLTGLPEGKASQPEIQLKVDSSSGAGLSMSVGDAAAGNVEVRVPARGDHKLEVKAEPETSLAWTAVVKANHWRVLSVTDGARISALGYSSVGALLMIGIALLFASRVNINEFSMHHFYKNRLVRCYLGASRGSERKPNPWTGFDSKDDLLLTSLLPEAKERYLGPMAIVNTAINVSHGRELATQERKAESFVFTPLYSGFEPKQSQAGNLEISGNSDLRESGYRGPLSCLMTVFKKLRRWLGNPRREDTEIGAKSNLRESGYRITARYGGPDGLNLGTATGISGAALNPNAGYHTSGPLSFLMTVFNVRLGWWLGNPRREDKWERPGPKFALGPLTCELTGQTNDRSPYVNLSDGGHFDNLGLYELVRRHCRYIVIGDGEEDKDLKFESLGGAIRKCRADFGADIDIDIDRIRRKDGLSKVHCVIGKITYREKDKEPETGWLVYFKASMTGDEPEDVQQFQAQNPEFPHQSTGDQFFGESQFESYRQLGLHMVRSTFARVNAAPDTPISRTEVVAEFFREVRRYCYPTLAVAEGVTTRLADSYSALMKRLSDDSNLRYLDHQLMIGAPRHDRPNNPFVLRRGFFLCVDFIQLMENVFADLRLDFRRDGDNPNSAGWMAVFRHWVRQEDITEAWKAVRGTYNPHFQAFFESLREE
jgi:hypothetical protein